MAEQNVTLGLGESQVATFEAIPGEAKTYNVTVDSLAGNFRAIYAPPPIDLIGDLNDDGVVNILDLTLLERYIGGSSISTPLSDAEFRRRADVNGDGRVNALDLTALERLIAGLYRIISDCDEIGNWVSDLAAVMSLDTEIKHSGAASIRQDVLDVTMWFNCRHLLWYQSLDMSNWLAYSFWHRCTVESPTVVGIQEEGKLLEFYTSIWDEDSNYWWWFPECRANTWEKITVPLREPDNASPIPPDLSKIVLIQITHTPGGAPPFSSWIDQLVAELKGNDG